MSKSLQDQLLSLGLARSKPGSPNKPGHKGGNKPHPKAKKQRKKPGKTRSSEELSLEEAYRLREQQTRQRAEQQRQRKLEEDRRRRELNGKIREIVHPNRLNEADAELSRNFLHKGRIRKVNVTAQQLKELNSGQLGVVYLSGGYHLLEARWISEVKALSEDHVPDLSGGAGDEEEFPVPDDLQW